MKVFLGFRSFLLEFAEFFMPKTITSAYKVPLISSFAFHHFLIFFICDIILSKISSTVLNIYEEIEYPCIVSYFSGKHFNFSPFSLMGATYLLSNGSFI